jgi:nickel/cobalt exporter
MTRAVRLLVVATVVVGAGVLTLAAPAQAHPLGNFTVNRYARVEVSAGVARVLYVLDLAEIPAFQERREVAADPEGYARTRAEQIGEGLELVVDGSPLELVLVDQRLEQPPGQGGLTTLRVTALYEAVLAPGPPDQVRQATFADTNQPDRIGWREIVVRAAGDAEIVSSDAPDTDLTDELRTYPEDRLRAPLDQRRASFSFTPGDRLGDPPPLDGSGGSGLPTDGFAALVTRTDLGPLAVVSLLAVAVGFGAVHAVGPGHGKTIMAAYLVSTRGRARDAVLLGTIVSVMHTASVLVLGLVLVRIDHSIATEAVYPLLTVASGVAVTGVGAWLLAGRWRRVRAGMPVPAAGHAHSHEGHSHQGHQGLSHEGHGHDHSHEGHAHGRHGHSHNHEGHDHEGHDHEGHGHDHSHEGHAHGRHGHSHALPADVAPLSRRGLVALGTSGGLFPSPSAVLVVVGAVGLGRAGLGLALLGAFSVGLAATLTVVGLGLVYGRGVVERRGYGDRLGFLPVLGAVALVVLGLVVLVRGILELT